MQAGRLTRRRESRGREDERVDEVSQEKLRPDREFSKPPTTHSHHHHHCLDLGGRTTHRALHASHSTPSRRLSPPGLYSNHGRRADIQVSPSPHVIIVSPSLLPTNTPTPPPTHQLRPSLYDGLAPTSVKHLPSHASSTPVKSSVWSADVNRSVRTAEYRLFPLCPVERVQTGLVVAHLLSTPPITQRLHQPRPFRVLPTTASSKTATTFVFVSKRTAPPPPADESFRVANISHLPSTYRSYHASTTTSFQRLARFLQRVPLSRRKDKERLREAVVTARRNLKLSWPVPSPDSGRSAPGPSAVAPTTPCAAHP
ncbi:hypothetical protein EIP91_002565 [Steccherinum ochraceum]|uniref:Uncharacterized protein n=1 Tax=Steccherinum ochraceum TaxID=92696 RepID=A0A4R0RBY7_9APHY|nr:hypothetical protein EIP91_002565 [Steccherinum ochraceum]